MTIRVFKCISCGHKMRLGHHQCGRCCTYKMLHQQVDLYLSSAVVLVIGTTAALAGS